MRLPGVARMSGARRWSRLAKVRTGAPLRAFFVISPQLIKAFALSGSSLSATHADELVQEVMLKVWQKAGGQPREGGGLNLGLYHCPQLSNRYVPPSAKVRYAVGLDDFELESEEEESFVVLHTRRGAERVRKLMGDLPPIRRKYWPRFTWRVNHTPRPRLSLICRWHREIAGASCYSKAPRADGGCTMVVIPQKVPDLLSVGVNRLGWTLVL